MASPDNPTAPIYQFLMNGVDYTSMLQDDTWSISQQWSRQGDTATFYIIDEHPGDNTIATALNFYAPALATVTFTDLSLGLVLFHGFVTMPTMDYLGPNLAQWQLQCTDGTYLADRTTVFGDFVNKSADQIIKTLVTQANCGLTTNNVQSGPVIPRLQINYLSLSQAWTKVSQFSSVNTTYGWYVDENWDLHYYNELQAGSVKGLFSDRVSDFGTSTYVPGYTGNYADDYTYLWDATSIRNSVTVRGGNYSNTQIDKWIGNGSQASFPLTYFPDQDGLNPTLTVGGVSKTVSVQSGSSATTDWVVIQNANGQWFLVANNDPAPATSALVSFSYSFLAPVISKVQDASSINAFSSLPNHGVFSMYIADSTLQNITSAQSRARREVHTYGLPEERVTFNTGENYTGHVRAGTLIEWRNGVVPDSLHSYAPGIDDTFLVLQNRISGKVAGYRSYQITAARVDTGGL